MDRDRTSNAASDEIGGQSDPLSLRLVTPGIDSPQRAVLGPGDKHYRLGLLAYHRRREGRPEAVELARALEDAWPLAAGERPKGEHRALVAAEVVATLDRPDAEAALEHVTTNGEPPLWSTIRKWARRGQAGGELRDPGRDFQPYVEAVGTETQPAALTLAQSMVRPPEVAEQRHAEWLALKAARGL